jgi:heme A synthase
LVMGFISLIVIAVMGAITSLGDAVFPVLNTAEAIGRSMTAGEHFLVRLRVLHPFAAIGLGVYLLVASRVIALQRPSPTTQNISLAIFVVYLLQLAAGFLNVILSAILPTQLVHLFLADVLWTLWVLLAASALAEGVPRRENSGETIVATASGGTD